MNVAMQEVPEGVVGIVGLDIVAAGMSRNAGKIRRLTRKLTAEMVSFREWIKAIDARGAIAPGTAWALYQRQFAIDRAVHDHLVHQLTLEAI